MEPFRTGGAVDTSEASRKKKLVEGVLGEGFLGDSSESLQILVYQQVFNFFLTRMGELEVWIFSFVVWNITCSAKTVRLIAGKKVTAVLVVTFSITVYMEEVRLENDFNLFPS